MITTDFFDIETWISITWKFPEPEKITLQIEIDKTGQKVETTCDWDIEDVAYLNEKQLYIMYRDEIREVICDVFDPEKYEEKYEDDHWDFYHDKL